MHFTVSCRCAMAADEVAAHFRRSRSLARVIEVSDACDLPCPATRSSEDVPVVLLVLLCAVVLVDTMFYAVVPPLLPTLVREVKLTKAGAGLLSGAYAGGMLLASIPCGIIVSRWGVRFGLYLGLLLLGFTSVGLGFGATAFLLDADRCVQGVGGAFTWAAALAWLADAAPDQRRGEMIGYAIAAATSGALLGPVLGSVASAVGRTAVFSGVAVLAAGLGLAAARNPSRPAARGQGASELATALSRPVVWSGMWMMFVPGVTSAIIALLAPLRISHLGGNSEAIGVTFLVAAGFESCVSFVVGRVTDRHGRLLPLGIGLGLAAVLLPSMALPATTLPLLVLIVVAGGAVGLFWTPALALFSETADRIGLSQAVLFALMNLGWAAGQLAGAGVGGIIAQRDGDLAALAIGGVLCAGTGCAYAVRGVWPASADAGPAR